MSRLSERGLELEDLNAGPPPERLYTCDECCGEGSIEIPRPFHDDPYFCVVLTCAACVGAGFFIDESEGDL